MNKTLLTLPPDYAQWLTSLKPDTKGYSARNLKYMKYFAQECPDFQVGQQSAAQLPWFHIVTLIVTLITKLADPALRDWYARAAQEQSWPRDTLAIQIKNQLHLRQGAAVTHFAQRLRALPTPLDTRLPSIEEIEAEFAHDLDYEAQP